MEKVFLLNQDALSIPCKLSCSDDGPIRRVVLGVHGLGGSTEDGIQSAIAEEMELFYAACMRFDLPCHGRSPMEDGDFTLKNCTDSLLAAAHYALEQFPQAQELCVFATGFGAYVTLLCMRQLQDMTQRLRLVVQTPSLRMHESILSMLRLSPRELQQQGSAVLRAPDRPIVITYDFYRELQEHLALGAYGMPLLILHGEQDDYIRMEDVVNFNRINEESQLVILPGTSHRFLEEGAWYMVLDLVRDWFVFEQVLLVD